MEPGGQRSIVVVLGGAPPHAEVASRLPAGAVVVAADGGLDHARALGLRPAVLVGDLDSVSSEGLAWARTAGIEIEEHPGDKDSTDAELAVDAALHRGADHLVVVGGGDRVDHDLAGLLLLTRPAERARVEAWWGTAHIGVLRGPGDLTFEGEAGELVSLLAIHGAAGDVTTRGLRFGLTGERLHPGSSRGVSNECLGGPVSVALVSGDLFVIRPLALGATP